MSHDIFALSLCQLAALYRRRELSAVEVTQAYLANLEPGPVYRLLSPERALTQAKAADAGFAKGADSGPLQGIPLALKDLLDTAGDVTAAGSTVLAEQPPAATDSVAAKRLDDAGAVFLGKTNMTELAFSGLGINPHFGTPGNAFDPERLPGGSSSGSAVAVATGLACAAIGSDTGGSVRIPAAFNGLVGLKTSDGSIPLDGVKALSTTLDTLGPITKTVEDGWHLWLALLGEKPQAFKPRAVQGLKLVAPTAVLQENLEPQVEAAFKDCCALLTALGAQVAEREMSVLGNIFEAYERYGSFAGHEALALYEELLEARGNDMDPRVVVRIIAHKGRTATDYIRLHYARTAISRSFWEALIDADAVVAPTVAVLPPKLEDVAEDSRYFAANSRVLRNTMVFNFLGAPAVSVPCGFSREGLPIGFMVASRPGHEALALAVAHALEAAKG